MKMKAANAAESSIPKSSLKPLAQFTSLFTLIVLSAPVMPAPQGEPFNELEGKVNDAVGRITVLEEFAGATPVDNTVDCGAGESINETLAYFGDVAAPLVLSIQGTCVENVVIDRDNVSLFGAPGASIESVPTGAFGDDAAIHVTGGAAGIEIRSLTITNHSWGLYCNENSNVRASNLVINGGETGVVVSSGTTCRVEDSRINGARVGVNASLNGTALLRGMHILDSANAGLVAASGGTVFLGPSAQERSRILRSGAMGIRLLPGGSLSAESLEVGWSQVNGVFALSGSTISFRGDSEIHDNGENGIFLENNTALMTAANNSSLTLHGNGNDIECLPDASLLLGVLPTDEDGIDLELHCL